MQMQIYCLLKCRFQPHCTSLQRLNKSYSFWLEKMKWRQSYISNLRLLWLILLLSGYSRLVKDGFSPRLPWAIFRKLRQGDNMLTPLELRKLRAEETLKRRKRRKRAGEANRGIGFFTMDDAWLIFEWFPLNCFPPIRSSLLVHPSTLITLGNLCGVKDNCWFLDDILFDVGLIVDSGRYFVRAKQCMWWTCYNLKKRIQKYSEDAMMLMQVLNDPERKAHDFITFTPCKTFSWRIFSLPSARGNRKETMHAININQLKHAKVNWDAWIT